MWTDMGRKGFPNRKKMGYHPGAGSTRGAEGTHPRRRPLVFKKDLLGRSEWKRGEKSQITPSN